MAEVLLDIEAFAVPGREQAAREALLDGEEEAWLAMGEAEAAQRLVLRAPLGLEQLRRATAPSRHVPVRTILMPHEAAERQKWAAIEAQTRGFLQHRLRAHIAEATARDDLQRAEADQRLLLHRKVQRQNPQSVKKRLVAVALPDPLWRQINVLCEASRKAVAREQQAAWDALLGLFEAPLKLAVAAASGRAAIVAAEGEARRGLAAAAAQSLSRAAKALPPLRRPPASPDQLQQRRLPAALVQTAQSPQATTTYKRQANNPEDVGARRAQSVTPMQQSSPSRPVLPAVVVSPSIRRQVIWGDDQPVPKPREPLKGPVR
jgi:hypothetical protein